MKNILVVLAIASLISLGFVLNNSKSDKSDNKIQFNETTETEYPVIVELFTSQGCSSCPSADKVLKEIVDNTETNGKPIYGLSFHVSYWNYLGWKDPYSKESFTDRQHTYGAFMRARSIYTPQMIVNGIDQFVGSSRSQAFHNIKKHLAIPKPDKVLISNVQIEDRKAIINFSIDSELEKSLINFALVERNLKNYVPRGENSGRELSHDNVVRNFETRGFSESGKVELDIPKDLVLANSSIVVYTQNPLNYTVLGAHKYDLSSI
ncbi:MAG: DUF1223 domain-containing protein [Bacteroidota bacterium]